MVLGGVRVATLEFLDTDDTYNRHDNAQTLLWLYRKH